jgi:diaminopimelate epimerase
MNYTQFHGNTFLFINKNTDEFPLPKESKESFLTYWNKLEEKEGLIKPRIVCNDGFSVSCQAHFGSYCDSRGWENIADITDMELGFPSESDSLITPYADKPYYEKTDLTDTIYPSTPIDVIVNLINAHGGIKKEVDLTMYYKYIGNIETIKEFYCSFINKDGSEASLCGNALLRLMEQEGEGEYLFKTISGEYFGRNNENELAIRMQKAKIQESNMPDFIFNVNVGNLHRIMLFEEDRAQYNFACGSMVYGDESCENIEHNEHIVWQEDTNTFQVRCFERGVGETQACGSGAYAVGVAMIKHFKLSEVNIIMKGGKYIVKDGFLIVKK